MRLASGILLLVAGACGRIGFDAPSGPPDAYINPAAPRCGGISRLADDFADGLFDDDIWGSSYADAPASYGEQNGALVIRPGANTAAAYAGYSTLRWYELREQRIVTRVTQFPDPNALVGIHVILEPNTHIGMTLNQGELRVDQRMDTMFVTPAVIPFDPTRHVYWAISERGGRVYFETSQDGVTFESFYDMVPPFSLFSVRVTLYAGTNAAVATPGEAHFDFISASGALPIACAVESEIDLFEDGFEGRQWDPSYAETCCSVDEMNGELIITTNGMAGTAARRSSKGYDLRGNAMTVELTRPPIMGGMNATLVLRRATNTYAALQINEPAIVVAQLSVAGDSMTKSDTRSLAERFLRVREEADRLYWEVSTDRQTWREIHSVSPLPFPVDDVIMALRGGSTIATAADSIRFDNLNAP